MLDIVKQIIQKKKMKFRHGDTVYLVHGNDNTPGMITSYTVYVDGSVVYRVNFGFDKYDAFPEELTTDKPIY